MPDAEPDHDDHYPLPVHSQLPLNWQSLGASLPVGWGIRRAWPPAGNPIILIFGRPVPVSPVEPGGLVMQFGVF